jgi:CheY-like chemotaxis protein
VLPEIEELATVLVCEDDDPTRELLCDQLTADRFRALPAPSASDALRLCGYNHPDLMLLDLGLPDAGGIDVLRKIRAANGAAERFDPELPLASELINRSLKPCWSLTLDGDPRSAVLVAQTHSDRLLGAKQPRYAAPQTARAHKSDPVGAVRLDAVTLRLKRGPQIREHCRKDLSTRLRYMQLATQCSHAVSLSPFISKQFGDGHWIANAEVAKFVASLCARSERRPEGAPFHAKRHSAPEPMRSLRVREHRGSALVK